MVLLIIAIVRVDLISVHLAIFGCPHGFLGWKSITVIEHIIVLLIIAIVRVLIWFQFIWQFPFWLKQPFPTSTNDTKISRYDNPWPSSFAIDMYIWSYTLPFLSRMNTCSSLACSLWTCTWFGVSSTVGFWELALVEGEDVNDDLEKRRRMMLRMNVMYVCLKNCHKNYQGKWKAFFSFLNSLRSLDDQ